MTDQNTPTEEPSPEISAAVQAAATRARMPELLAAAATQAVSWIGAKAVPILEAAARLEDSLGEEGKAAEVNADLTTIRQNARAVMEVKKALLGPGDVQVLRPAMVTDVVQAAAFHSGLSSETLTITTAPDTPFAICDTTQLARVLTNLFRNALEANAGHLSATITPTLDRAFVAISVADDGDGIPDEIRSRIWMTFFTTKGPDHYGLGLASALLFLTQMGGRITFDSQPGHGSTFTLVLPAAPDDEAVDLSEAPENILFIDEEDDAWATFAANVLKLAGKNVVVQGTPAGAAEADLILVDEALTTMPVDEVIAALSEAGVADKAVVVTAALNADRAARHMEAGVRDVALKPYTYTGLAAFLNYETDQGNDAPKTDA